MARHIVVVLQKPYIGLYLNVLKAIRATTDEVVFLDQNEENVLVNRPLGLSAISWADQGDLCRNLRNLTEDPIPKAQKFLESNAKQLHSTTSTGQTLLDNFTQLLILECTNRRDLIYLEEHERTWNFFIGKPLLTTEVYPDDLDTTAAALLTLEPEDKALIGSMLDDIVMNVDVNGIVCTYYDPTRQRIDPVVCVNILRLFYRYGRGHELAKTLEWVQETLYSRTYLVGTRYYPTPEAFLYFFSRFLETSGDEDLQDSLIPILRQRVTERIGFPGDAICISMRLLACSFVGLPNPVDVDVLCSMQCEDGGWPAGSVYRYGKSGISIGNRGLATALSISAIRKSSLQSLGTAPLYKSEDKMADLNA